MKKWIVLLALVTLLPLVVVAQETEISDTLAEELAGIETYVTEVRGLELQGPLIRVFPDRETVSEFLLNEITDALTDDIVAESMAFYIAFDFMSPDVDIVDVYLTLLQDQVGGYYNPEDKTMNTILISGGELSDDLPMLEEIIYAHEFVHALQDQHFDLQAIGLSDEGIEELGTDQILALQALVEGDATLVMTLYTEKRLEEDPMAAFSLLGGSLTSGSLTMPAGTPDILTRELLFPYDVGATFVTAVLQEGGWEAVDAAFTNLPQSTEQIFHPEKYISGELPIEVTLTDATQALGEGWTMMSEETMGEFYLRAYLDTQLERDLFRAAAGGWGGDRFQTFQNEDGDIAFIMRIAWDTSEDSAEFADAYTQFADLRFNGVPAEDGCWSSPSDTICLMALDNGDSLISRAPDAIHARLLLASQE
jgi:hypothetical protein